MPDPAQGDESARTSDEGSGGREGGGGGGGGGAEGRGGADEHGDEEEEEEEEDDEEAMRRPPMLTDEGRRMVRHARRFYPIFFPEVRGTPPRARRVGQSVGCSQPLGGFLFADAILRAWAFSLPYHSICLHKLNISAIY